MRIREKIQMEHSQLVENGPITIVAFGDSVTHGSLSGGEHDYESVYWNRLRKKLYAVRNYVPINVINAGIGATSAKTSLKRIDSQVLRYFPDLIIVCFGLNDINGTLEDFVKALEIIFEKCQKSGADVIFMTPNMLNTYVSDDTDLGNLEYAKRMAEHQNSGKMDLFMRCACELAASMNIAVCDCYSMWKELSKTQDITKLLANRINHPIREMHELFANSLFDIIMGEDVIIKELKNDTMYHEVQGEK